MTCMTPLVHSTLGLNTCIFFPFQWIVNAVKRRFEFNSFPRRRKTVNERENLDKTQQIYILCLLINSNYQSYFRIYYSKLLISKKLFFYIWPGEKCCDYILKRYIFKSSKRRIRNSENCVVVLAVSEINNCLH